MVRRDKSCRLLDWTAPMWCRSQIRAKDCSNGRQLLERM